MLDHYPLHRKHTPGRAHWSLRAVRRKLQHHADKGENLVVVLDTEEDAVRIVIPLGPETAFAREVMSRLTFDARGSCTFDVNKNYMFTWRKGIRFDGKPYLREQVRIDGRP